MTSAAAWQSPGSKNYAIYGKHTNGRDAEFPGVLALSFIIWTISSLDEARMNVMLKNKIPAILIFCLTISWISGCAIQQDIHSLQERMIAAERQSQELQRRNAVLEKQIQDEMTSLGQSRQTADKKLRTQYASVNVNMDTMQQELRLLTGRIEEIEYLLNRKLADSEVEGRKQQKRLEGIALTLSETEKRLAVLERYLSLDPKTGAVKADQKPTQAPVQKLYDRAKGAYDQGDWPKARQLFTQLLQEQPKSENADNAQFWIGETYYNEQWYEKAILEYQTVIEKYPKGNKVPAAMLKQGMSFQKLGDQSNARLVLKRLTQKYPKTNEASIATAKLKDI
jgi:tol-pal system protein YbgF